MEMEAVRLIAEGQAGDTEALGRLLEMYRDYLRLLAHVQIGRRLQGKLDASDIVQECFLDAHRQFAAFRGQSEAQLVPWLREILAGTLANQVRRYFGTQARDVRLECGIAVDLNQSSQVLGAIPVDPHSSPSQQATRGEQALLVTAALARLPDDYRTVLGPAASGGADLSPDLGVQWAARWIALRNYGFEGLPG